MSFSNICILPGSVATHLTCGENTVYMFCWKFHPLSTSKSIFKIASNLASYCKNSTPPFFSETQCILLSAYCSNVVITAATYLLAAARFKIVILTNTRTFQTLTMARTHTDSKNDSQQYLPVGPHVIFTSDSNPVTDQLMHTPCIAACLHICQCNICCNVSAGLVSILHKLSRLFSTATHFSNHQTRIVATPDSTLA